MIIFLLNIMLMIFLSESSPVNYDEKSKLINGFYSNKHLKIGVSFVCWPNYEKISLLKDMMNMGIRMAVLDVPEKPLDLDSDLRVHTYLGVVVDLDCPNVSSLLTESTKHTMFNGSYYWLMLTKNLTTVDEILAKNGITLNLESEVIMATNVAHRSVAHLYDVYQTAPLPVGKTFYTHINARGGIAWNNRQWKLDGRTNLHGLTLNGTVVVQRYGKNGWFPDQDEVTEYLTNYEHNYYDTMTKFSYAVFMYAMQLFNFKPYLIGSTRQWLILEEIPCYYIIIKIFFHIYIIGHETFSKGTSVVAAAVSAPISLVRMFPTPSWGYKWNGTFDGMVSLIMNGTANLGITTAGIRTVRLPVIDFVTAQTWLNAPKFILRHPRTSRSTLNIFLHPLSPGVWFSIAVITAITITGTHFIGWVQVKVQDIRDGDNSWSSCIILVIAALCQQGSSEVPRKIAGRIFFLSLLIFTFVVYQFYTCSIVSTLLTEPPRTISKLSHIMKTHISIGIEDILTARDTLYRYQGDPEIRKLYKDKIAPQKESAYHSVEEGVNRMRKGGFAFYVDPAAAYKLIEDSFSEQEKCDLTEVFMVEPDIHTLPIAKRSPYKKLFNFGMRLALEYGIVKRERRKWHSRRPECVLAKNHRTHVSIGIPEFKPALVLLFIGIIVAVLILIKELFEFKKEKRTKVSIAKKF